MVSCVVSKRLCPSATVVSRRLFGSGRVYVDSIPIAELKRRCRAEREIGIMSPHFFSLVGSLRQEYGADFAQGYRSDTKLGTVLEREKVEDLSQLLKKKRR
jgi:hypothetical protein